MHGWVGGWVGGWEYGWKDGCMDAWMHGHKDAWMHGCMDARMHAQLMWYIYIIPPPCCTSVFLCVQMRAGVPARGASNSDSATRQCAGLRPDLRRSQGWRAPDGVQGRSYTYGLGPRAVRDSRRLLASDGGQKIGSRNGTLVNEDHFGLTPTLVLF